MWSGCPLRMWTSWYPRAMASVLSRSSRSEGSVAGGGARGQQQWEPSGAQAVVHLGLAWAFYAYVAHARRPAGCGCAPHHHGAWSGVQLWPPQSASPVDDGDGRVQQYRSRVAWECNSATSSDAHPWQEGEDSLTLGRSESDSQCIAMTGEPPGGSLAFSPPGRVLFALAQRRPAHPSRSFYIRRDPATDAGNMHESPYAGIICRDPRSHGARERPGGLNSGLRDANSHALKCLQPQQSKPKTIAKHSKTQNTI